MTAVRVPHRAGAGPTGRRLTRARKWRLDVAISRMARGIPDAETARHFAVAKSTVSEALKPFRRLVRPDVDGVYLARRGSMFRAAQIAMLGDIVDPAKRKRSTTGNAAYALRQLFDIERLDAGQSTVNLALHELVERVERERARKRARSDGVASVLPGVSAGAVGEGCAR